MNVFGNSFLLSEKVMNALWEKQRVIADNIANNDTPGYKSSYVTFEDELRSRLGKARGGEAIRKSIATSPVMVHRSTTESARLDGNNVQVEAEYLELARTQLQFDYQVKAFNSDLAQLRTAVKG